MSMTLPPFLPYSTLKVCARMRISVNPFNPRKSPGVPCRRIAEDRIIRIHAIDADVCPTWTHATNRDLPDFAARQQRWNATGCWSDFRLELMRIG